jgi:hypothetical protein
MKPITADQFAGQLRAGGCCVEIGHRYGGTTYLHASKPDDRTMVTIVFEDDRFNRAFAVWVGVSRRRWPRFRTMKAVRFFLGVHENPPPTRPEDHPLAAPGRNRP